MTSKGLDSPRYDEEVLFLTGNHPIAAKSIARQVGIISEHSETRDELAERLHISVEEVEPGSVQAVVIYGDELEVLSDEELIEFLTAYEEIVLARIIPNQKVRIVQLLQRINHCVAITEGRWKTTRR
ncbi:hypothetical protein CEXT_117881 [Caerostris extrusa]|uniref:Uncharacterized protein n=1 Tax=Caerostris extrusa TaxID=172846 RepID=A0AAV4WGC8_CAEEX|nr:hypothetical protein CEXT_117881 [Caerostris extrusa]